MFGWSRQHIHIDIDNFLQGTSLKRRYLNHLYFTNFYKQTDAMSLPSASRHLQYEKIYSVQGCYVYGFHDRMVNTVCVHLHEVLIEKKRVFVHQQKCGSQLMSVLPNGVKSNFLTYYSELQWTRLTSQASSPFKQYWERSAAKPLKQTLRTAISFIDHVRGKRNDVGY